MKKLVRVKAQSAGQTRNYEKPRTYGQKKFCLKTLMQSDGLDKFIAELTGDAARQAPTFAVGNEMESRLSNLKKEVTICFAINQKKLSARQ